MSNLYSTYHLYFILPWPMDGLEFVFHNLRQGLESISLMISSKIIKFACREL